MTTPASTTSDPVAVALEAEVDCYHRLARLAELQHEHVRQGRTEELLAVLEKRQGVLEELAALERTVAPARRQWTDYLSRLCEPARATAESLMAETKLLLERITQADRDDALVLQQRKLSLGRQIGQVASAGAANRRYGAGAHGSAPSRIDLAR